jgi:hypothetical protein
MQTEETGDTDTVQASLFRAAEYVRMSTEHQQYSTENQADKIREYAARRGIEIVRTYADEGKSGLRIDGRLALQRLIKDVEMGAADFQIILVYDVSRWGRFQDADESACRVGGGALARWPPSAAQTARAVFPHAAFTKARDYESQSKELTPPN